MRRYIFAAIFAAAVVSCGQPKTRLEANLDNYAVVHLEVPASINDISDNGKEVLNLYRFAADEADKIFWDQNFGDKALMDSLPEPARDFAMVNYGPWNRITGKPFVKGYGDRPFGSNFYPEDMTEAEFEAFADPAKNSPYTMIRRDEAGKLVAIPYHEAYKEHVDKIYNYLVAAADITIKPSVRNYLLKKAEALRTDDYYESELAWLDMNDTKMDLVIGPNEKDDDEYRGLKASYGAVVMLKDTLHTAMLSRYADMAPELQAMLPCDEKYKSFVPGSDNNIFACDVLYYAGNYNAGFKVIAINLPYDPRVQAERGTRTILFNNVIREKFNRTVFPVGQLLLESSQKAHLDVDAFYWNIAFREVAHGLGVKQTLDGRDVVDVLGADAYTLEEAKANILGVYLAKRLGERHVFPNLLQKEDFITTFVTSLIRSARFGVEEGTGKANVMIYNYLVEKEALVRNNEAGYYTIDYSKASEAIEAFAAEVLKLQAEGDAAAASAFVVKYSEMPASIKADVVALELEKIPVDIRFVFAK